MMEADVEIRLIRMLLGQYLVGIGTSRSGPVLRNSPVEIYVGKDYQDVLTLFPFLRQTYVDGQIRVRLGDDVAAEYGRLRAEFLARLPRLILFERVSDIGNDLSRGHLTWARGLHIISTEECIDIMGRSDMGRGDSWSVVCFPP